LQCQRFHFATKRWRILGVGVASTVWPGDVDVPLNGLWSGRPGGEMVIPRAMSHGWCKDLHLSSGAPHGRVPGAHALAPGSLCRPVG
jgi:hypothetical protein